MVLNFVKRYPMFVVFVVSYTAVHLVFEYNFWFTDGELIFGKYAVTTGGDALAIAERVYFAKATWMFALVWLLVLRFSVRAAITYSFLLYAVELLVLFPIRPYSILNAALAAGLLIELILKKDPEQRPLAP